MKITDLICFGALLLAACQGQPDAARASLLETDHAFAALSLQQGFDAAFQQYAADDVVFLPESGATLRGKGLVHESLGALPKGTRLSWTPQDADAGPDVGYSWGVYEYNGRNASGQPTLAYGNYLSAWRRRADGWRLQVMMLNRTPGPAD